MSDNQFASLEFEFDGRLLHQSCLWGNTDLLTDLIFGDEVCFVLFSIIFALISDLPNFVSLTGKVYQLPGSAGSHGSTSSGYREQHRMCSSIVDERGGHEHPTA